MAGRTRRTIIAMSLAFFGLAITTALPAGASNGSTFPIVVKAANGSITIKHRPTAIMSLSATSTEMLYAIGAGKQVKEVDKYSNFPKSAPRTNLNGFTPNVEAIVKYKPDLVIVDGDTGGLSAELAKFGIPVLSEPPAVSLNNEYSQFDQLGQATGHLAQAHAEVSKVRQQIRRIVQSTPKPKSPATYYYELSPTFYSAASSTFIGQVFGLLGLKSIADSAPGSASSGGYPQLSSEFIIKSDPTYVFLADTLCCGQSSATVAKRPGWSTLTAIGAHRIIGLNDDIATRWGPRVVNLLRQVSDVMKSQNQ
jgi:iron complex transport system substrate-binding protein